MPHRRGIHTASRLDYDSYLFHAMTKLSRPLVIHGGMRKTTTRERHSPKKEVTSDSEASITLTANPRSEMLRRIEAIRVVTYSKA